MEQLFNLNHEVLNDLIEKQVEKLVQEKIDNFLSETLKDYILDDFLLSREAVALKLDISLGKLDGLREKRRINACSLGRSVKFKNSEILEYIKNLK